MTTPTTAPAVTKSELFRQFLEGNIVHRHARSGRIVSEAPVSDYLWGFDSECIDEAIDYAKDCDDDPRDELEQLAAAFRGAAANIDLVIGQFDDVAAEQIVPLPDPDPDADDDDPEQLYRPLTYVVTA